MTIAFLIQVQTVILKRNQKLVKMVSDYSLRPLREEDWDRFHEMEKTAFEEGDLMTKDNFDNSFSTDGFIALEINELLVGYIRVSQYGSEEGHLGRIGVAGSHQGQGWGKVLMEHAIDWFKNKENIKAVHLYTQDYNKTAQSLYMKYGFMVSGTTWSYFIPFEGLEPKGRYTCQIIDENDIDVAAEMFPSLPSAQIRKFIESEVNQVLTLKNETKKIVGAARFTPSYPGVFPFEITDVDCFDDFIIGIQKLSLPEFDYVRSTFTDNEELAKLCGERGYHLHHRLYKMTLRLVD
ncbi:MAG: GNAT family N-acetyltransferase [Candidatus Thorarchaeota archaeon]|nr:GNAT family N-acetyltransferase [Candidatus Thorarchaeota archaeon]